MWNLRDAESIPSASADPHFWKRVAATLAVVWGLVLIISNSSRLPQAGDVPSDAVYAALRQETIAKVCARWVFSWDSDSLTRPGVVRLARCDTGIEPKSIEVPGYKPFGLAHTLYLRRSVSDVEARAVVAEFRAALAQEVSKARRIFVIKGVAWWVLSIGLCLASAWVLIRRSRIEQWRSHKLLILWFAAGIILCAWFAVVPSDVVTFFGNSTYVPDRWLLKDVVVYGLFPVLVPGVVAIATWAFFRPNAVAPSARDKQWFVTWVTIIAVTVIWWGTMDCAVKAAVEGSPDVVQATRDLTASTMQTYRITWDAAYERERGPELTKRLLGSVVVLGVFGVWFFGRHD